MITALYASLCALLLVKLSLDVIKLRRKYKVRLGDGGVDELQTAIRIQANAIEYIPITLLLVLLLEMANVSLWIIHLAGMTLLVGRLIHAIGLKNNDGKKRVLGMQLTIYLLVALAVLNIFYLALGYVGVWTSA